ncbi:hypothetical protein FRC10_007266 [Ceratobasidium sp. 414]|nr:hypothetical protein FRC10_007266 [Ceratobasidium sp. 414]
MTATSGHAAKLGGYEFYHQILKSPKYIVAPMVDQSELFCSNDPQKLLASALVVQDHCDAIDINLGCPQDIARRGRYGSYLQDDWDLVHGLINVLHTNLRIPVTAKFRIFPSVEKTVEYAKMMERAGAQILTCHGRTREQRGSNTGLADWKQIAAVKRAVKIPVFANGNILYPEDVAACLEATGCDGVMSAEGNLYNPALFAGLPSGSTLATGPRDHTSLALEYLDIVRSLKTETAPSAVKGHLFKLLRPALVRETDLRDRLGKAMQKGTGRGKGLRDREWVDDYAQIVREVQERMERDKAASSADESLNGKPTPHWFAQPYVRPLPALPPNRQVTDPKTKPKGSLAANLPPAELTSISSGCVECPPGGATELEGAEAEIALDGSTSGTKRAATPVEVAESKRPRLDEESAAAPA